MRAAAACQFTLSRFGAWRLAVTALAGGSALALVCWSVGQSLPMHWGITVSVGVVAAAVLGLGAMQGRIEAVSLRWDGLDWHVGTVESVGREASTGTLTVALDLGAWMLLRFQAHTLHTGPRITWLPAQRRGLESQWHALRCAVYSPRPGRDAEHDAAAVADR